MPTAKRKTSKSGKKKRKSVKPVIKKVVTRRVYAAPPYAGAWPAYAPHPYDAFGYRTGPVVYPQLVRPQYNFYQQPERADVRHYSAARPAVGSMNAADLNDVVRAQSAALRAHRAAAGISARDRAAALRAAAPGPAVPAAGLRRLVRSA